MNKISLTLITVIVGISLVFTFLQMEKPAFEIENKFIIVPQNSVVANDMNNIINNIINIASEQQSNESVSKKRAMVKVDRLNETSMFQVNVLAQSEKETKELSEQVTYNILKDVSKYYDVNTDVNINLMSGGKVEKNILSGILPIVFWALVGILVSILVVMIVELVTPKRRDERVVDLKNMMNSHVDPNESNSVVVSKNIESAPVYNLQDSVNSNVNTNYEFNSFQNKNEESEVPVVNKEMEQVEEVVTGSNDVATEEVVKDEIEQVPMDVADEPVIEKRVVASAGSVASSSGAPSNLPVADFDASKFSSVSEKVAPEEEKKSESDEPTEEELKARLNKLLKGEI